jgi:hypothetical protein
MPWIGVFCTGAGTERGREDDRNHSVPDLKRVFAIDFIARFSKLKS